MKNNNEAWIKKAETALRGNDDIVAAGQFGLSDDYKKITAGAIGTSLLVPNMGALGEDLQAGAVIGGARALNAEQQGVSEVMLVAVSKTSIYVFSLGMIGGGKLKDLLFAFDRESTDCKIKKFGICRHLNFHDKASGKVLKLTGTTLKISPSANGDRAVLKELAG